MENSNSILDTIKSMIGIDSDYTDFDDQLILHINTSLASLSQIGVGPKIPIRITDSTATWDVIYTDNRLQSAVDYVYIKTKLLFDPPDRSFVKDSYDKELNEITWRLTVALDEIKSENNS